MFQLESGSAKWNSASSPAPPAASFPSSLAAVDGQMPRYMSCVSNFSGADLMYEVDVEVGEWIPRPLPKKVKVWDCAFGWADNLVLMAGGKRCVTQALSKEVWIGDMRSPQGDFRRHRQLDLPMTDSGLSLFYNEAESSIFLLVRVESERRNHRHIDARRRLYRLDLRCLTGWHEVENVAEIPLSDCGIVHVPQRGVLVAGGRNRDVCRSAVCLWQEENEAMHSALDWVKLPCLSTPRALPDVVVAWNSIVCIGGRVGNDKWCNAVEQLPSHAL